jgi:hypothetical protein
LKFTRREAWGTYEIDLVKLIFDFLGFIVLFSFFVFVVLLIMPLDEVRFKKEWRIRETKQI